MPKKRLIEKVGGRLTRLNTSAEERKSILKAIEQSVATGSFGVVEACDMFGLSTTAYYNWKDNPDADDKRKSESRSEKYAKAKPDGQRPARKNSRSLSPEEVVIVEGHVNEALASNMSLTQYHIKLTDEHKSVASLSTYYRIAREMGITFVKPKQRKGPKLSKIAQAIKRRTNHIADGPMQVLMWDITEVKSKRKKKRYVFAIIDLFSRFCLHADVFDKQGAEEAFKFFKDLIEKYGITKGSSLKVHSDNGSAMLSELLLTLLQDYHIEVDTSRPYCSNDNPFIESFFSTGKEDEEGLHFENCETLEECRSVLDTYVYKYNFVRYHSGINYVTPAVRHLGPEAERKLLAHRQEHLDNLYKQNPERYINGPAPKLQPAGPVPLNPSLDQMIDLIRLEPRNRHHQKFLFRMLSHHVSSIEDVISNPELLELIHHRGLRMMIDKAMQRKPVTENAAAL